MTSTTLFDLGTAGDLQDIFIWSPNVAANPDDTPTLIDAVEHAFNQTLLRDLAFGSWASVYAADGYDWRPDQMLRIRVTSPDRDVSPYAAIVPNFIAAMKEGLAIYGAVQPKLAAERKLLIAKAKAAGKTITDADLKSYFLPPFGLAMAGAASIQLLHYPPAETLTYMDYLYSPTNRRWENLLGWNGWPGGRNTELEAIVDIGPIAADGGSLGGELIAPVLDDFAPYAKLMLPALLRPSTSGAATQPLVAYGGPVGAWLTTFFGDQIRAQNVKTYESGEIAVGEVFTLKFSGADGPETPMTTANHPIKFNYYDKDYAEAASGESGKTVAEVDAYSFATLQQDLIAAGWQAEMAANWENDPCPKAAMASQVAKWGDRSSPDFPKIYDIFREQVIEFALEDMPVVSTPEWMAALVAATKDVSHTDARAPGGALHRNRHAGRID